jgi:hypothetical protein
MVPTLLKLEPISLACMLAKTDPLVSLPLPTKPTLMLLPFEATLASLQDDSLLTLAALPSWPEDDVFGVLDGPLLFEGALSR